MPQMCGAIAGQSTVASAICPRKMPATEDTRRASRGQAVTWEESVGCKACRPRLSICPSASFYELAGRAGSVVSGFQAGPAVGCGVGRPDGLSGGFSGSKICVCARRGHSVDHRTAARGWGGVRPGSGPAPQRRKGVQLYHTYSQHPLFCWLSLGLLGALWAQPSRTHPAPG